jgi:hypothetical protein
VVHVDPKNVAIRTELASCLYYNGDLDGAISAKNAGRGGFAGKR